MFRRRFFTLFLGIFITSVLLLGCVNDKEASKFVEKLEKKPGEGKPASYWVKKLTDPQLKSDAVKALMELKDKSVVPQLVELFKKDKSLRADIAEILGLIGDKSVASVLLEGLVFEVSNNIQEQRENDRINEKILGALASMGEESAKPAVIKLLSSTSAPVLAAAVKAEKTFK
ncbi:MAG: HEAT repeat domain-containing protein, partial [Myxococcota bacterium]